MVRGLYGEENVRKNFQTQTEQHFCKNRSNCGSYNIYDYGIYFGCKPEHLK